MTVRLIDMGRALPDVRLIHCTVELIFNAILAGKLKQRLVELPLCHVVILHIHGNGIHRMTVAAEVGDLPAVAVLAESS